MSLYALMTEQMGDRGGAGDGVIRRVDDVEGAGAVWAAWRGGNLLVDGVEGVVGERAAAAPRIAMWSGSMAVWEEEDDGVAAADPRTWGGVGWARLGAVCEELAARVGSGVGICLRTHASHVLSDVPSCVRFLREWGGKGFSILLDPAAMLAGTMIGSAPDHLERIYGSLGGHEGVAGVVVTNLDEGLEPGGAMRATPVHRGVVDPAVIAGLVGRYVPRGRAVVVLAEEDGGVGAQRGVLAGVVGGP